MITADTGWSAAEGGGHVRHVAALGGRYVLRSAPPTSCGFPWSFAKLDGDAPPVDESGVVELRWDAQEARDVCDDVFTSFLGEHDPKAVCYFCIRPKPPRWNTPVPGGHFLCESCERERVARAARLAALSPEELAERKARAREALRSRGRQLIAERTTGFQRVDEVRRGQN